MFSFVYELLPGIVVSCVAVLAAHLGLWEVSLPRVPSYVIGTSCVLLGMFVSALLTGNGRAVWFYLAHLVPVGAVVAVAWAVRGEQGRRRAAQKDLERLQEAARNEQSRG